MNNFQDVKMYWGEGVYVIGAELKRGESSLGYKYRRIGLVHGCVSGAHLRLYLPDALDVFMTSFTCPFEEGDHKD